MAQEEKLLLLKDLCARLPYGVKIKEEYGDIIDVNLYNAHIEHLIDRISIGLDKLILRPLSSLTKEEIEHILSLQHQPSAFTHKNIIICSNEVIKYLYSRHVDICGLIPLGLALEAPEGMYT